MGETRAEHLQAAQRHEQAAESHDRAAKFWLDQGDSERAQLQMDLADYERHGAALERRWADLVARTNAPGAEE